MQIKVWNKANSLWDPCKCQCSRYSRYSISSEPNGQLGQVSSNFAAAKNGQVSSKFAAAKNGQVSSKFAAAKNGQVGSKFAAAKKWSS